MAKRCSSGKKHLKNGIKFWLLLFRHAIPNAQSLVSPIEKCQIPGLISKIAILVLFIFEMRRHDERHGNIHINLGI